MGRIVFANEGITEVNLILKILELKNGFVFERKKLDNSIEAPQKIGEYKDKDVFLANFKGVDNLKRFREEFCNNRPHETDRLIFIIDADYYNDEKKNGGYKNRKKSIENHILKIEEKIKEEYGESKLICEYYITPDNKSDGMTEDICLKSIRCQKIVNYIEETTIPDIEKIEECNIKNKAKSIFMMVSATQDPLRGSSHLFIDNCFKLFDQEAEEFQNFKKFIFDNLD